MDDDGHRLGLGFLINTKKYFQKDPRLYGDFLIAFRDYRAGQFDICELYRQVAELFHEHPYFLVEFSQIMPGSREINQRVRGSHSVPKSSQERPNRKRKSTTTQLPEFRHDDNRDVRGRKIRKVTFFLGKAKEEVRCLDDYRRSLPLIYPRDNQDITRNDFRVERASLLAEDSDSHADSGDRTLTETQQVSKYNNSRKREKTRSEDTDEKSVKPDFQSVSSTTGNYSSRKRDKPKQNHVLDKIMSDYREKRLELDILKNRLSSAIESANKLRRGIEDGKIKPEEEEEVVKEHLNKCSLGCIERIYGEQGPELLDILFNHPRDSLPVILRRLHQKLAELRSWQLALDNMWDEYLAKKRQ